MCNSHPYTNIKTCSVDLLDTSMSRNASGRLTRAAYLSFEFYIYANGVVKKNPLDIRLNPKWHCGKTDTLTELTTNSQTEHSVAFNCCNRRKRKRRPEPDSMLCSFVAVLKFMNDVEQHQAGILLDRFRHLPWTSESKTDGLPTRLVDHQGSWFLFLNLSEK